MSMNWKISEAKQEFSRVVEEATREIQWIFNRDARVAAMISAAEAQKFLDWKRQQGSNTVSQRLARLTELCGESNYSFEAPVRTDRDDDFGSD